MVSAVPGHRLRDERQREGQHERLRMIPVGRASSECRMQFPQHRIAPRVHIVGIATFVEAVENSLNRIACETASSERTRAHVGPPSRKLTG